MNRLNDKHPALSVLGFFAGPQLQDCILGDIEERYHQKHHSRLWLWRQTLMSIPSLCWMHVRTARPALILTETLFASAVLCLILIWETGIARTYSWPIARELLEISPLSVGNTCRAVYIGLYSGFVALLVFGLSCLGRLIGKGGHFCAFHSGLVALMAILPILYLAAFPLPTDGSILFRLSQCGVLIVLCSLIVFGQRQTHSLAR